MELVFDLFSSTMASTRPRTPTGRTTGNKSDRRWPSHSWPRRPSSLVQQ
ncbi:hypothetical protein WP1_241 [Pseudomonas phage WP1]